MNRWAWAAIAAATWGWACPVEVTAIPPLKSRYRSPDVVVTHDPSPDATSRSVTLNHTFDRLFALIASSFDARRSTICSATAVPDGTSRSIPCHPTAGDEPPDRR